MIVRFTRSFSAYWRLMRMHQIAGMWLLLWPTWWAIALASPAVVNTLLLGLTLIGAIAMRSAGCIVNDMADREFDKHVERTKNRPLASGELSMMQASICLVLLLSIGLLVLLQLNLYAIILSFFSCIFVVLYPFMKRIMAWPQLFLALTFNFGTLIGWVAATGQELPLQAFILYGACYVWTLGYDTIYAMQDKKDDIKIGVKSTAVDMGKKAKFYISFFYGVMIVLLWVVGYVHYGVAAYYYNTALIFAALQLLWQVRNANELDPKSCMLSFKSNMYLGAVIFFGILLQKWYIYYA